ADISGQPLRKCGLETIPHTYRKGYRPEYGQHDKKERPYGIYDQCRCLEKYLQKVAKPFLYGFFYLIGLSVKYIPDMVAKSDGDHPNSSSFLSNSSSLTR